MSASRDRSQLSCGQPPLRESDDEWELYAYRDHTLAVLRRYLRLSLELGRLPSLLGGELFRARVTAYRVTSFEDLVIFVHDVESCLSRLSNCSRRVIANIVFQEYTEQETAVMMGCTVRTARRWYHEALDEASQVLLRLHLMEPFNGVGERLAREGAGSRWGVPCELSRKKPAGSSTAAASERFVTARQGQHRPSYPLAVVKS